MEDNFSLLPAVEPQMWDDLVENSLEGTLFLTTSFLQATGKKFRNLFVLKGTQIRAGLSFLLDPDDDRRMHIDDPVIYNGIIYKSEKNQNQSAVLSDQFEIAEYSINELSKEYSRIEMSLSPRIKDMRPFLWHNYGGSSSDKFSLNLRYTSFIDLNRISSGIPETEWPLFKSLSYSRRQEVRYARRDGVKAELSEDVDALIELYIATMRKQQIDVPSKFTSSMRTIMKLFIGQKKGHLFIIKNNDGTIVSGAFFCCDSKRAYYLWGANHPYEKNRYSGTIVLWDAFIFFHDLGYAEIDLEGVNSPNRGWFKLSFGGSLSPYFHVLLAK